MKQTIKTPNAMWATSGNGYWSREMRNVKLKHIEIGYVDDEHNFGELRAYFNRNTWNIEKHGLIYTDGLWIKSFRTYLTKELGLPGNDVDYSEQGMQGDDYVSLDVGEKFLTAWAEKTGQPVESGAY
jgi:hypothetical protein